MNSSPDNQHFIWEKKEKSVPILEHLLYVQHKKSVLVDMLKVLEGNISRLCRDDFLNTHTRSLI